MNVCDVDLRSVKKEHRAFDCVAQFAHITGPRIGLHARNRGVRESGTQPPELERETFPVAFGQGLDVFAPLAQGLEMNLDHVDPVVEIFTQRTVAQRLIQIAVGRRNDARAGPLNRGSAESVELLVLKHPQQFGLGGRGRLGDLIQQQGSAVGLLEATHSLVVRPGKGAAFVAEQLRLEERLGECSTIDLDKGSRSTR